MGILTALALAFFLFAGTPAAWTCQLKGTELENVVAPVGQVVSSAGQSKEIRGSGVVISPEGLVITCYHVLGRSSKPGSQVLFEPVDESGPFRRPDPNKTLKLEVVRTAPEYDLALLQIRGYADGRPLKKNQSFPALRIGKSEDLHLLDVVYIIGFPKVGGETVTVIEGHVAGKDTANQWLKLDASISRGYSGGAVVNARGELVGIPAEIRADIEDLGSDQSGTGDAAVLYGILSWVRPAELIAQLTAPSRSVAIPAASSDTAAGAIHGAIVSSSGVPLAGALVGLLKFGSKIATQENLLTYARTDDNGKFVLRTTPGTYTMLTHCAGYETATQSITVTDAVNVKVALRKKTSKSNSAGASKQHEK